MEHKKLWLTLAVLWTLLVAFLCLVSIGDLPKVAVKGMDKYVHFTFHFLFTILWSIYFFVKNHSVQMKMLLRVLIASLLFGILIEFLQEEFTATRKADILDVLANFTGASIAVLGFIMYKKLKEKPTLFNK